MPEGPAARVPQSFPASVRSSCLRLTAKLACFGLCAVPSGVCPSIALGQGLPPNLASATSQSGQFVVQTEGLASPSAAIPNAANSPDWVRLEPRLVTISCERIKQNLSRELGVTSPWRGKVFLALHPARAAGQKITITSERFRDGWQYRVDLPDVVERTRYTRAVVQVLLLELANREAGSRLAEVPLWLTEGLSQHLLASSGAEIILQPPRDTVNGLSLSTTRVSELKENPVDRARKRLGSRSPISFEQLSWQSEDELAGAAADLYRCSAQLFVAELLRMRDGRASLRVMLTQLPRYYNWQFAFLQAFRAHFERPLDVEKWWALCLVQSAAPDHAQTWTIEESWKRLDQTVHTPAPPPAGKPSLGPAPEVTLQTVIRQWDRTRQTEMLTRKLHELELLRARVSPELAVLVQEYCQVIETHLQNQARTSSIPLLGGKAGSSRVAQETLRRLDALDERRETLRPPQTGVAADRSPGG